MPTSRSLTATVGSSGLLLSACGGDDSDPGPGAIAITAEGTAAAARTGVLDRQATQLAALFGEQEQAHADALIAALEALGASAPPPPKADSSKGVAGLRTQADFARVAITLELKTIATFHEAQLELQDRELLSLCARIMANEGQHLAVLRTLAGETPVPHAFERGVA